MFHVVAGAALVYHDFVADCRYGFCAGLLAYLVQNVFGVCLCVAKDGYFDKFVKFERKTNVFDLVVAHAVFADLEDWIYRLRHTAKFCALSTCYHCYLDCSIAPCNLLKLYFVTDILAFLAAVCKRHDIFLSTSMTKKYFMGSFANSRFIAFFTSSRESLLS